MDSDTLHFLYGFITVAYLMYYTGLEAEPVHHTALVALVATPAHRTALVA